MRVCTGYTSSLSIQAQQLDQILRVGRVGGLDVRWMNQTTKPYCSVSSSVRNSAGLIILMPR